MFYLIAGLWIFAALLVYALRRAQVRHLAISCPCLAVAGLIAAVSLYALHFKVHAYIVLGIGLGFSIIILIAFLIRRNIEQQKVAL